MYIFDLVKMVALSKDIKAESTSTLLKKKPDWKGGIQHSFIYTKYYKNPKDKKTNIKSKKNTCRLIVSASEVVEGYMILTRRGAALPTTIVFYHDHVFLEYVFYTRVIFCIFSSWSM